MSGSAAGPVFHSSARPGYSTEVSTDPGRVLARKLPIEVDVQFATQAAAIKTREGVVQAHAGDAIVTGRAGDKWRVSLAHFGEKYQAVPPTTDGQDGRYRSLTNSIMAVHMSSLFEVLLADGVSRLRGQPGDWLVDYGDGSLGVVAPAIFASTYEIVG
jgi:PGDYG protein